MVLRMSVWPRVQKKKKTVICDIYHTLVVGDPAISFSRKTGIAKGPNSGVAFRHALVGGQTRAMQFI